MNAHEFCEMVILPATNAMDEVISVDPGSGSGDVVWEIEMADGSSFLVEVTALTDEGTNSA